MDNSITILHLEDDSFDAALIQATLRESGLVCTITRVETEAYFVSVLVSGGVDLILADLTLPAYDGRSALVAAQKERPRIPFIFVSGTLGEDEAIESLKLGATDYVLKKNLSRLPTAVKRALEDARVKAERREFEMRAPFRKNLIIPPAKTTTKLPRVL